MGYSFYVLVILVILLGGVLAALSFHQEGLGDPTQRLYTSNADYIQHKRNMSAGRDLVNQDINRQKYVSPDVSDLTHPDDTDVSDITHAAVKPPVNSDGTKKFSWDQYTSSAVTGMSYGSQTCDNLMGNGLNGKKGTNDCEVLNLFLLRQTNVADVMSKGWSGQQNTQQSNFMNALNAFVQFVQITRPDDASNLQRVAVANQSNVTVDSYIQLAQTLQDTEMKARNLVVAYTPLQADNNMMAYMQLMLLINDLTSVIASRCR